MQKYLQKRNLTLSASDATLLRFVPICQVIDQEWRKLGTNIKFGSKFIFEFIFFDHLKNGAIVATFFKQSSHFCIKKFSEVCTEHSKENQEDFNFVKNLHQFHPVINCKNVS